jgi:hypothetical protein
MIFVAGACNSKRAGVYFRARRVRFGGVLAAAAICSGVATALASTALGAVLLYRDRSVPVVPIATVADHHVLVSLGGAF